jgi:hypothetical protein
MDHQECAGPIVGPIIGIWEPGIDGEIVIGVRIHLAGGDGVEALRGLAVALLDFWPQLARPAADGIGAQ